MAQTDISMNVEDELIDVFINDEGLNNYAMRVESFDDLLEMANELFIFDAEQLERFEAYYDAGSFND